MANPNQGEKSVPSSTSREREIRLVQSKQSEGKLQKEFLKYVRDEAEKADSLFHESWFCEEFFLPYEIDRRRAQKDTRMPDYRLDVLEVDRYGRFHLWELKKLDDSDLLTGKVAGQIIMYDFLFSTSDARIIRNRLRNKNIPNNVLAKVDTRHSLDSLDDENAHSKLEFQSWNIVAVGGLGFECAAGENPIMWTYVTFGESYLQDRHTLTPWHFFPVRSGYYLSTFWELSIFYDEGLHPDAWEEYLRTRGEIPNDFDGTLENWLEVVNTTDNIENEGEDEEIEEADSANSDEGDDDRIPEELFLKFIGRVPPGENHSELNKSV